MSTEAAHAPDFADSLSKAELLACAQVLALSLATHRAKFGVLPLAPSPGATGEPGRASPAWCSAAQSVMREALGVVRAPVLPPQGADREATPAATSASGHDKRRQLRVSVTTPVQVSIGMSEDLLPATLVNISWGGAALRSRQALGKLQDHINLHLPAGRGQKIVIVGTILRVSPLADGSEYGLRFESLSTEDEDRLEKVLEILVATPQHEGRRTEARLVQRLDIEYCDSGEFAATLEDISANGLKLIVPDPLEVDQSLLISLSSADTDLSMKLRARVVHQTRIEEGGFEMYRVGLRFEHPTAELEARVTALVHQLAILRPATVAEAAASELDFASSATAA